MLGIRRYCILAMAWLPLATLGATACKDDERKTATTKGAAQSGADGGADDDAGGADDDGGADTDAGQ